MLKTILTALALVTGTPLLAQPAGGEAVTIGTTYKIASKVFAGDRRITVRLPAGYAEQPDLRFPVVYLIDGGPEQDFPHIAGIVQSRDMNWSFGRFILIGVETVNRRAEISPPVEPGRVAAYKALTGATAGGADTFRRFIASDVKPWVEANFRTDGHDAVMGESLAALFILDTLFAQPALFDDWIAVSPSLWYDDMKLARGAPASLKAAPATKERIYLTVANEGFRHLEGIERLVDALRSAAPESWRWAYVPLADSETHSSIYHTAALDAFRLLYGTPTREYRPHAELLGRPTPPPSAAELALYDTDCDPAQSLRTTPGASSMAGEALYNRCLVYDLGPRAREGTLGQ